MGPAKGFFFFFFDCVADSELWLQSLAELGASPCAPHRLLAAAQRRRLTTEAALDVGIAPLHGRCCHCFPPKCIYYRINTITGFLREVWKKRKPCRRNSPSQSLKWRFPVYYDGDWTSPFPTNIILSCIYICVCIYMHIHVPNRKQKRLAIDFSVSINQFCFV